MSRELPPLNALRAFEAVARLGSVSRAAEELHVTHGAISRQLRALEEAAGRPLFSRQGRGLALTPTGLQLHERIGAPFARLREGWAALRQLPLQAPFVLGCSASVLARWMIPRLERLGRELPTLRLHLAAQEDMPGAHLPGLDAALLLAAPPWPRDWQVHELATERIGPVLSPRGSSARRLRGQPARALGGESLLHTTSRPQAWPEWARAMRLPAHTLKPTQAFDHLYFMLEAAVAGLGVAIAPEPLVADELAAGRLLAPWGFRRTRARWILAAPARSEDARVVALAKWLRTELAERE